MTCTLVSPEESVALADAYLAMSRLNRLLPNDTDTLPETSTAMNLAHSIIHNRVARRNPSLSKEEIDNAIALAVGESVEKSASPSVHAVQDGLQSRLSHCRAVISELRLKCPRGARLPMGYYFTDTPDKKLYRDGGSPGCYCSVEDSEDLLLTFYGHLQPRWYRKGFLDKCESALERFRLVSVNVIASHERNQ